MTGQNGSPSELEPAREPQPNAALADDILIFLGPLPPEEYAQRRLIRACRNAANLKVTRTESANARTFAWIAVETATEWIYAPATADELSEVVTFLRHLLTIADQAEDLEVLWLN